MTDKTYAHVVDGAIIEMMILDAVLVLGQDILTTEAAAGWIDVTALKAQPAPGWTTADGGKTFVGPVVAVVPLATVQTTLCADIDAQAEAQRLTYVTPGAAQMGTYLLKQTRAGQATAAAAANPPMTAAQGAATFVLLAAEIGITVDPSTKAPAVDVFGVARAVTAAATQWEAITAAIEAMRLKTKAAINAATTAAAAQAAHDAAAWAAAPIS